MLSGKIKFKELLFPAILGLGAVFISFLAKNSLNSNALNGVSAYTHRQAEARSYRQYGSCNYYVVLVERVKKTMMRDLDIASDKNLANFLEELKDNPGKMKEFKENKKFSSINIEILTNGWQNNGQTYPSDLEKYEDAANVVCDPKSDEKDNIMTNLEVIKILAQGLKTYNIPEDKVNDIWPKSYLENKK